MERVKTIAILGMNKVEDLSGRLNKLLPEIEAPNVEIMNIQVVQDTQYGITRCDALVVYRVHHEEDEK